MNNPSSAEQEEHFRRGSCGLLIAHGCVFKLSPSATLMPETGGQRQALWRSTGTGTSRWPRSFPLNRRRRYSRRQRRPSSSASGAAGFADFGMSRPPGAGGGGASPASTGPGSLEPISPQGLWVEFGFLDGVHSLNDVAIWNDNEETYDQGWKHLAIQVTTDHPGDNDNPETWNWTTVFNGILPQSPGPGDGVTPAHTPGSFTLAAAVINLGGVSAAHVAFVNTGAGDEASYIKQYNNLSDPNDSGPV